MGLASTPLELSLAITVNRLVNADTYPLLGTTALNHWFVKRRGKASVVLGLVWALILEFPGVELKLESSFGVTGAYFAIAACAGSVALLAGALWRDAPELVGVLPDLARPALREDAEERPERLEKAPLEAAARPEAAGPAEAAGGALEVSFTRAEAASTGLFWSIVLMQFAQNTLWQACHFHLLDILSLRGLSSGGAQDFYAAIAVARTVVSLLCSIWFVDWLGRRTYLLLLISAAPQLVVSLLLAGALGPDVWTPGTAAILGTFYGAWGGVNSAAGSVVFAQVFGRRHIGAIQGLATGAARTSGAVGPLLFAVARDWTGSYALPLRAVTLCTVVAAALLALAPFPWRPAEPGGQLGPDPSPASGVVIGSPADADVLEEPSQRPSAG